MKDDSRRACGLVAVGREGSWGSLCNYESLITCSIKCTASYSLLGMPVSSMMACSSCLTASTISPSLLFSFILLQHKTQIRHMQPQHLSMVDKEIYRFEIGSLHRGHLASLLDDITV